MSIKISELPSAETLGENDIVPIVQDGTTKKITAGTFKAENATVINSSSTNDTPAGAKAVYDYAAPKNHADENTTYGQGTESKYGHCKTINNLTASEYTAGEALSSYQGKLLKDAIDGLDEDKQDVIDALHKIGSDSVEDGTFEGNEQSNRFIKVIEDALNLEVKDFATGTYLLKAGVSLALNGQMPVELVSFGYDTLMITKATDNVVFYYIFDCTDNEEHCRLLYGYEDITERTGTHKYLNIDDIPSTAGGNIDITNGVISTIGNTIKTLDATNDIIINNLNVGVYQVRDNATYKYKSGTGDDYVSFTISSQTFMVVSQIEAELPVPTIPKYYYIVDIQNGDVHYGYCKWLNSTQGYSGRHYIIDQSDLVDKDYLATKLAEKQAEIDQLYDQIPTATATGETINVQDSSNLPIQEFEMLGNATQDTTTGKNLFNKDNPILINGFVRGDTGLLSTPTDSQISIAIAVESNTQYTISGVERSSSNYGFFDDTTLVLNTSVATVKGNITNGSKTFTTGADTKWLVFLVKGGAETYGYSKVQLEKGSSATTYEPYTGGKPAPNPDYPQDIHVVTGDNTVVVNGKQLFNKEDVINAYLNNDGTTTNNNGFRVSGYIYIAGASKVTVSGYVGSSELCCFYDSSQNFISGFSIGGSSYTTITAPVPNDAVYIRVTIKKDYLNTFQLEKNATATPYEPYTAQTQLISLGDIKLAKIPDTDITDVMFKAVSSNNPLKPSYYDTLPSEVKATLTVGSWYKENTFADIDVTGTESVSRETTQNNNYRFNIGVSVQLKTGGSSYTANLLCNRLVVKTGTEQFLEQQGIRPFKYNTSYFLQVYTDETKQYTNDQFKTWLASHNLKVIVELATPTYTEITDTTLIAQLENVLKMHTNKNVTNAWIEPTGTNAQAGMVLMYRQDLATLIAG